MVCSSIAHSGRPAHPHNFQIILNPCVVSQIFRFCLAMAPTRSLPLNVQITWPIVLPAQLRR
ncbi:hypothetical protein LguiA_032675 [Lonicera macranthoides]